jgi:signal transduction histidine kinase
VLDLYRSSELQTQILEQLVPGSTRIEGDSGRLRQLLHNLLKNSLEAVRDVPDARITVATRIVDEGGMQQVELCVDDNGPGIEPGVLENIFEPYVSTKPRGSGLGMAIVKKIVEEHNGTISVGTSEDGGAQIRIRLLLSEDVAQDTASQPRSDPQTSASKGEL